MLSSTSSSETGGREAHWLRAWCAALALVVAAGAGAEWFWRSKGFVPSVQDTPELWDLVRSQATAGGTRSIALLGSSRTLLGIDPRVLSSELGDAPVCQLGIDGSSPLPILRDLADDERFRGTVICEVAPSMFFDASNEAEAKSSEWVRHYHQRSRISDVEARLRLSAQQRLAILRTELNPKHMVDDIFEGHLPQPGYTEVTRTRFRFADFQKADLVGLRRHWAERFAAMGREPTPEEFAARRAEVEESVRRIQRNGGSVVFLQMVSSGAVHDIENTRFPRQRYWDVFAAGTSAVAIHFEDVASLAGFVCHDDSHLDGVSARSFSEALAQEITRHVPVAAALQHGSPDVRAAGLAIPPRVVE